MAKHLRKYDFCGREAILRKQDIPRRYTLRATFGADGQGTKGRVKPAPVAMLNPCISNNTQYIFLGKPPQPRDFVVELTLSFAHLRPTGKPETHDSQWNEHPRRRRRLTPSLRPACLPNAPPACQVGGDGSAPTPARARAPPAVLLIQSQGCVR